MASELVPQSAEARAHRHPLGVARIVQPRAPSPSAGDFGLRPQDLHGAYNLPSGAPSAQTIALVDAYNDPSAEADLKAYDEQFGLPACTAANGCFEQVNERGETTNLPFPKTASELAAARSSGKAALAEEASGWSLEISLDIETARAVCQTCHILLVEASTPVNFHLEAAERTAEALGANEISNSWGGPEEGETESGESAGPFNDPGTVITASAGDSGYLDWDSSNPGPVEFPAASPHVVAVGGTRLQLSAGGTWAGETVWNGDGAGGGGCSTVFKAPPWQSSLTDWSGVGCSSDRSVADLSADADPYTGVAVSDSLSNLCEYAYTEGGVKHVQHWCTLGGTSLASPLIAGVFALAGGAHGVAYPAATVYANAAAGGEPLRDVTSGSNGECTQHFNEANGLSGCTVLQEAAACAQQAKCLAGSGYDGPSGLGTPDGLAAFEPGPGGESSKPGIGSGGSEEEPSKKGGGSPGTEGAPGGEAPSGGQDPASGEGATGASGNEPGTGTRGGGEGESEEEASAGAAGASVLTALTFTPQTLHAARSTRHRIALLGFSFNASTGTHVRVSLAKRVVAHHHAGWRPLRRATMLSVTSGRNTHKLATGPLAAGTYRLTLSSPGGAARSVLLHVL
jgi:hypothetical protein